MIAIREEITAVPEGRLDAKDNPCQRPTPWRMWRRACGEHPYLPRARGPPGGLLRRYKYWAPVNRVDNVYGDRNLFCACLAVDSYRAAEDA